MKGTCWTNQQGGGDGDRYLTVDCHPNDVTRVLNLWARQGWLYKATISNLQEGLLFGWLRILLEREQR